MNAAALFIFCKSWSHKYMLTCANAPLLRPNLKHKAVLTSSGLIRAENSQQLSDSFYLNVYLCVCGSKRLTRLSVNSI